MVACNWARVDWGMVVSFGLGMMGQPEKGFLATLNGVSGCLWVFAVDLLFVFDNGVLGLPVVVLPLAIEAAFASCVAGDAAVLLDLQQDGIAVAVGADGKHALGVP